MTQGHARLGMQRARGEHAQVGAHAPQRVDRLGARDGPGRRVQPPADEVDGQARMVGERDRDVRIGAMTVASRSSGSRRASSSVVVPPLSAIDSPGASARRRGATPPFAAASSGRRSGRGRARRAGRQGAAVDAPQHPGGGELLQVAAHGVERARAQGEIRRADLAGGGQPAQDELTALFAEKLASCVNGGHALQNSAKSRKKPQMRSIWRGHARTVTQTIPPATATPCARWPTAMVAVTRLVRRIDPGHRARVAQRHPHGAVRPPRSPRGPRRHR